jgi:hypothetical protein
MTDASAGDFVARKIVCLINSAAYSRNYFEELAPHLRTRGYEVVFVLDSHLSDVINADGRSIPDAYYFTDFMKEWLRDGRQPALSPEHRWTSLFSDFDRFLTMDIRPPLARDCPVGYAEIPGLLARFFERIFEREKPCAVLYEQVSNAFAIAAYHQTLSAGVPFCSLCPSRVAGRIEVSTTGAIEDFVRVGEIYRAAGQGAISAGSYDIAANYIRTIDQQVPDYMKPQSLGGMIGEMSISRKYLRTEKLRHVLRSWRYRTRYREDCALAFQHGDPIRLSMAFLKRAALRRLRASFVAKYYQTTVPADESFLLYPLHFHPEASTSVLAQDFIDELSVIKAIAFRLPAGMKLYVKEHPSAIALQPRSFYRQLDALPNVRLLAAGMRAKELARRSRGVVCLTSTLGFEAAVLNRPVITFGDVLYGYFPNVRMIRDYSALDDALRWAIDYQPVPAQQLLDATAAYVQFGAPGSFDFKASLGDSAALGSVATAVAQGIDAHDAARTTA